MESKIKRLCWTVAALTFLISFSSFSQTTKTWTKIDKPKQFEISFLNDAGLMIPKTIKRYYKLQNNDTTNYYNEAIYQKQGYLIKGNDSETLYTYYNVSFFGADYQFTLNYNNSIGRGFSCQGTFFLEEGITMQTEYCYGTSSGTVTVKQNGKEVYSKQIDTEKQ